MNEQKWYKTTGGIIALLILFFPAGLFLMWRYAAWNKKAKWVVSGIFVVLFVIGLSSPKTATIPTNTTTAIKAVQATPSPTQIPTPVKQINIEVTSLIVKKVDGKYRYFFDIRNKDTEKFEGSVEISLYNESLKSPLGKDTFSTKQPIEPELGTSVYLDTRTGPVSVHGADGISKYSYTVTVNNAQVKTGEGIISTKLEDLSR